MNQKRIRLRIARGWNRIGKTLAAPMIAFVAIIIISGGIVLPLWFLATRAPAVYGIVVLTVSAVAIAVWLLGSFRRRSHSSSHHRRRSGAVWIATALAAVGAYATLLVYTYTGLAGALPLLAALVASIGFAAGGGSTGRE